MKHVAKLGLALAILGLPALASALKWKRFETWGWSAELPADWTFVDKIKKVSTKPYDGKWILRSTNKRFRVRIKIHVSKGLPFKERAKRTYMKLYKRLPDFKLLRANTIQVQGRDIFYMLGSVVRKLKKPTKTGKKEREYVIFRMMTRFPKRKVRLTATFLTGLKRLDDMMPVVERFLDTFAIVDTKSADAAFKKLAAQGGDDD